MPYTDEQWRQIETLGHRIDKELKAHDVRLTMGASRRSCRSTTWTARNGTSPPSVRRSAALGRLVRRLKKRFAPGGVLHFGQGKWYPGESLPRWALGCWWRKTASRLAG